LDEVLSKRDSASSSDKDEYADLPFVSLAYVSRCASLLECVNEVA
jgi:hypothetical protein